MTTLEDFRERVSAPAITHVSFDVFDTLLFRPTRRPDHMYQVIGAEVEQRTSLDAMQFSLMRRRAENEARVIGRLDGGHQEVSLAEIYERFSAITGISGEVSQEISKIEERVELENFSTCKPGIALVECARQCGKSVVFLSDTYFTESFMRLALKGIIEDGDELLISSAAKLTKHSGDIYKPLLQGKRAGAIVHVGDNLRSDVQRALKCGLSAFYVKSASEWARGRGYMLTETGNDLAVSIAQGLVNNACMTVGREPPKKDKYRLIGYCALGPFWVGFVDFIEQLAERERVEKLFFLARDGFVLQKAFSRLAKRPTEYLSVSRHSLYLAFAHVDFEEALPLLLQNYAQTTIREVLAKLLPADVELAGLRLPAWAADVIDQPVNAPATRGKLERLARLLTPQIKQHAADHFKATSKYFRQVGMAEIGTAGIVDIGWHGSLQVLMQRLLVAMGLHVRLVGAYVGLYSHAKRPLGNDVMEGYLFGYGSNKSAEEMVQAGPSLVEVLHAAPHGTTVGYLERASGEIEPVYAPSKAEEQQYRNVVHMLHSAGLKYVDDFLSMRGKLAPAAKIDGGQEFAMNLLRLVSRPTLEEATILGTLGLHPNFGPADEIIKLAEERGNIGRSMWPIGRAMMHRAMLPEWFDEDRYFIERPDVLAAVRRGDFACGYHHYVEHGKAEIEGQQ